MKFMCTHTVPPHSVTADQAREIAKASQLDGKIRGYRSFLNLSEGKAICVMEAPDRDTLARWYEQMKLPFDSIVPVEYEGERGTIREEAGTFAATI